MAADSHEANMLSVEEQVGHAFLNLPDSAESPPTWVLIAGGVAAGKTSVRRDRYSRGFVALDAAEIFLRLCKGRYVDFPPPVSESELADALEAIGSAIARRAVRERRNIVTEIIGADLGPAQALIEAIRAADYRCELIAVTCDLGESMRRNIARSESNISAYYTEPYHLRWIHEAVASYSKPDAYQSSDIQRVLGAVAFAAEKHRNQRRKDEEASPYINHPIALAELLASVGVEDVTVLQAALLHDTVEDTNTTFKELGERFGEEIQGIVREVTDDKSLPKEERKRLQVEHAAELSRGAKLVKLADKVCNLRDIAVSPPAGWSIERKQKYFDWAKSVVDRMRGTHPELESLFDIAYAARP